MNLSGTMVKGCGITTQINLTLNVTLTNIFYSLNIIINSFWETEIHVHDIFTIYLHIVFMLKFLILQWFFSWFLDKTWIEISSFQLFDPTMIFFLILKIYPKPIIKYSRHDFRISPIAYLDVMANITRAESKDAITRLMRYSRALASGGESYPTMSWLNFLHTSTLSVSF